MPDVRFEPIIGLEVHAELLTRSKMFCGCEVVDSTQAEPNTAVCEICTGMPGTLPVINQKAVEYALRVALALHCRILPTSLFARKNYFYPDLPKGYQISQYELPLAVDGWLEVAMPEGERRVRIRRVHLEEDTGKLFHRNGYSLVDYNRSGVPLLEIVSEPDLRSPAEARAYALGLRSLLRYLEVNSGDMEKGVIRFEANVSLRAAGSAKMGTRTEIKNLNSFRSLSRSIEYEIARQEQILRSGGEVTQETMGWDEEREVTLSQRSKEEAHDYRYFPEPDLPPLYIDPQWIETVRQQIPELPEAKKARYVKAYNLTPYSAGLLASDRSMAEFFESALHSAPEVPPDKLANWITGEVFGLLNQASLEIAQTQLEPAALARLVHLVESGKINAPSAKIVLQRMFHSGGDPQSLVHEMGLSILRDRHSIERLVRQALESNPDQLESYLAGRQSLFRWFFGQVMSASQGRADPSLLQEVLQAALDEMASGQPKKPNEGEKT